MTAQRGSHPFNVLIEIGELGSKARQAVRRYLIFVAIALMLETGFLYLSHRPGCGAFALVSVGCVFALGVWSSDGVGLPLLPLMTFQSLLIYGIPIAAGHEVLVTYSAGMVLAAGTEVLIFNVAMALAWKVGIQLFQTAPSTCHALREFTRADGSGWSRLGLTMIFFATGYQVADSLGLTQSLVSALPGGSYSIIEALVSVVSASGFFLMAMSVGGGGASPTTKFFFWALLLTNALVSATSLLLYTAGANLITVAIGFFWSNGRVPWKYLTVVLLGLSFFNTGKTTMRTRYWNEDNELTSAVRLSQIPAFYIEWANVSYDAIAENQTSDVSGPKGEPAHGNKNLTLLDRIDNLQNLLFVVDAMETDHIAPLHGATYAVIPPLLIPRIFWPDKPRSHEGQVLLNVHFGRQDLNSTLITYVAWGLLPEAYGDFGPILGAICLGGALGLGFAWAEKFTARKLLLSTEGFLSLSLQMNLMNSFEMVASVLVTSTFQSFIVIVAASAPFVHKTVSRSGPPREA
jgi:hypothetical protein